MKKLLLITALLLAPLSALAINVSVPQSTRNGDMLIGKLNGNYSATSTGNGNIGSLLFSTTTTPLTATPGLLQWNATDGTLDLTQGCNATLQIGQEMFTKVRNNTGVTITDGSAVYFNGRLGNRPTIALARSNSTTTSVVEGLATEDIADNTDGCITTTGYIRQIKTDYSGWTAGAKLYVSTSTAGALTVVEPSAPHHADIVGTVGVVGGVGIGSILVQINRHIDLSNLADVNGTPLTSSGQFPVWNQTGKYFDFTSNINNYASLATTSNQTFNGGITLTGNLQLPVSVSGILIGNAGLVTSTSSLQWTNANSQVTIGNGSGLKGALTIMPTSAAYNWYTLSNIDAGAGEGLRIGKGVYPTQTALMTISATGIVNSGAYQGSYLQGTSGGISLYPSGVTGATSTRIFGNNGSGYVERMTVLSNGNVGIGSTTPTQPLVVGTSSALTVRADGTLRLVGEATAWEDLLSPIINVAATVQAPSWSDARQAYFFHDDILAVQDYVFVTLQLPHAYKEGTNIGCHLHWLPSSTNTGTTTFSLEYTWTNYGAVQGATTKILGSEKAVGTAFTSQILQFPTISGTGKTISSVFKAKLMRESATTTDTFTGDAYADYFDCHAEIDSFGSDSEYGKTN